ncbi:metal dependent phosphohydrolase [Sarocladium implicatum]|nr:metal dependent phosphohydrolase [Sarocladium implicatum]
MVFAAAIFHDMGACDLYNGSQRFEVEGADAAEAHLTAHGVSKPESHKVWVAIALHTSAGIAERIDPFTRLIRTAVKIDFSTTHRELHKATSFVAGIEKDLPRLNIEKVLADAVVQQAEKIPELSDGVTWPDSEKHPKASWPGILLKAHMENPGQQGVSAAF